jgi:hypothetical protein
LLTLVIRGARIDHQPGDHDDWANAVAGAHVVAQHKTEEVPLVAPIIVYKDGSDSAGISVPSGIPARGASEPREGQREMIRPVRHRDTPWTPEEDELLQKLARSGESAAGIANQ